MFNTSKLVKISIEFYWLILIFSISLLGCHKDNSTIIQTVSPNPSPESVQKSCVPSSPVEELGMSFPQVQEVSSDDYQYRKQKFKDALSINAEIIGKDYEDDITPLKHIRLRIQVWFRNINGKELIIFEPIFMTLELKYEFLQVYVETTDGKKFGPLMTSDFHYFPKVSDFYQIQPQGQHCKEFELRLPYAEGDSVEIQGRDIPKSSFLNPGLHRLKIFYENHIVGFDDFDLNPWIGKVETNWITFTIP